MSCGFPVLRLDLYDDADLYLFDAYISFIFKLLIVY